MYLCATKEALLFVRGVPVHGCWVSDQRFRLHSDAAFTLLTWETGDVIPLPPRLERSNKIDLLASHDLINTEILLRERSLWPSWSRPAISNGVPQQGALVFERPSPGSFKGGVRGPLP